MDFETGLCIKVALIMLPLFIVGIRLLIILPSVNSPELKTQSKSLADVPLAFRGSNIMVLLGSGGHTGEMMRILTKIDLSNFNRTWVSSSGDNSSILKCKLYEDNLTHSKYSAEYIVLHRARRVGESLVTSVINISRSFISTTKSLYSLPQFPSVLLLNGPGTSVPLAYMIFVMKFLGVCRTRIIYIESLARVKQLSLSGMLILPIADRFIVQWEQLYWRYKRAEYHGILI